MKKLLPIGLLLLLFGCVEESNVSDRSIRGRWHMTSMRISEPVDLNRNGTASMEMLDEFGCLYNENILISRNGNNFTLNHSNLFYDNGTAQFFCVDEAVIERNFGDIEKVDEYTLRLHFTNANPTYAVSYTLFDDVLSKTYTASYQTSFNNDTQTWTYSQVQIRKEYRRD